VIGADAATPPGPGKPVTIVDSGLDITHEEFSSRPNTILLNTQTTIADEDDHGTEVASVIGAPINGLGLVGVYPEAVLRSYDASPDGGITAAAAIRGIEVAADRGPGVINISFGGYGVDPALEAAIEYAFRRGSLVVASAGNDGMDGNPLSYPASYPHVLTVGATDMAGEVADFSSESNFVDLVAPGVAIPVAEPVVDEPSGYLVGDSAVSGTSFSAPMVSAAAAWVWSERPKLTNTQLFDIMRFSAHDIPPAGHDRATGWGMLSIPSALSFPAPPPDPLEPNESISEIVRTGLAGGEPPITTPARRSTKLLARVDRYEDPDDVYRVFVPAHGSTSATTTGGAVDLRLFPATTRSIAGRPAVSSSRPGTTPDHATIRNASGRGVYAYVEVRPGRGTLRASYTLRVSASTRP